MSEETAGGRAVGVRPAARSRRAASSGGRVGASWWLPYALLFLPALLYGTFVIYPALSTLRYSFYEWDGLTPPRFTGLSNYTALLADGLFLRSLLHNALFVAFYTLFPVAIALLIAALLSQGRPVRGLAIYRLGLFAPQVIPLVVVGVVWRWMYSPVRGSINAFLGLFGVERQAFLGDAATALPAVGLVATWVQYGFALVLFLAGIQRIDTSLYDAVAVDGGGAWHRFRYVTVPGLRGEIVVAVVVGIIAALRVFDLVYVMTNGGPANATRVVAYEIWQRAFRLRQVGGAAAAATLLVLIILVMSRLVLRFQEREA